VRWASWAVVTLGAFTVVACSTRPLEHARALRAPSVAYDPHALPAGPVGESIAYGHAIVVKTQRLMKGFVRADMSCADCHLRAGTQARGGSFVGVYGRFPQWNKRAHRVIALQDRIAECFLYSMNGRAPAYNSKAMIAIVAYIAWLSRGTPIGARQPPADRYVLPAAIGPLNLRRGATLYAANCSTCHGSDGQGLSGFYPPLWGERSFNDGAGMAHLDRIAGFVRYNMPQNDPGSLSVDEAYDVAGFVLGHKRPHFHRDAMVATKPLPAKYF
jgi:thiosulfate dehydrogenase